MGLNILVTGGTGYIGSHTAVALMAAGHEVFVIARSQGAGLAGTARHRSDVRGHLALAAVSDRESPLIPVSVQALHFS